jgi:hypothetical protein
MMEEQVFGKMLSLRLDVSNGGSGAGSRGIKTRRDDRARRRGSRAGGARDKTNRNGETRVRFDLGSADAVAGWTRFRDFADASAPWSLEMYGRANAETLREIALSNRPLLSGNVVAGQKQERASPSLVGGSLAASASRASLAPPERTRLNDALANLTSVSLRSGRGVGDAGAAQLARALGGAVPMLRSLDVSGNDLGPKAARALADALCDRAPTGGCALERLDVSGNHIGSEGARALADALVRSGCPRLKSLDVSRNLIGAAGVAAVAELLVAQATRRGAGAAAAVSGGTLHRFGESRDAGAGLRGFRAHALRELSLRHNGCGDAGAKAVAAAMRKSAELSAGRGTNTFSEMFTSTSSGSKERARFDDVSNASQIRSLNDSESDSTGPVAHSLDALRLGFNGIGPTGASALADAVAAVRDAAARAVFENDRVASSSSPAAKSVVLGELDLACNAVGPEGARALGGALDDGVARLDLGNNAILCAGAKELARALVTNATTTDVCLAGNDIKAEGAWWIAAFFAKTKRVSRLAALDLGSNAVGDAGACDLAEELGECGSLRHLDLRRNDITNVGATSFCEAFRKLDEAAAADRIHDASRATAAPSVCLRGNAVDSACQTSIREAFGLRIDVELQVKRVARHA